MNLNWKPGGLGIQIGGLGRMNLNWGPGGVNLEWGPGGSESKLGLVDS